MSLGCRIYSSKYFEVSFETTPKTTKFQCVTPCGLIGWNLLSRLQKGVVTLSDTASHTAVLVLPKKHALFAESIISTLVIIVLCWFKCPPSIRACCIKAECSHAG
jgi:hypothetical protein